ncbi:MAG: AAA family ATPase, partial [Aquificaceae bacterium]|nr:AAA family ATPase [Aquificaceae bacterium]
MRAKILIENFKVFGERVEIDFSDYPVYAIVGKNASGKSTILDAVNRAVYGGQVQEEEKNDPNRSAVLDMETSANKCYKIRSTKGVYEPLPTEQQAPSIDFVKLLKNYPDQPLDNVCRSVSDILGKKVVVVRRDPFEVELDGRRLNPHQLSAGMQAIFTMEAILNYPRIGNQDQVIFVIEEPETFLHPNLLKEYMNKLINFFDENADRFKLLFSTHSAIPLSMLRPSQIVRVVDGKVYTYAGDFAGWYMMTDQNKAELFFADRAVLVEGFSDKLVYSSLLHSTGTRPERHNVLLLHIDGVYNREKITEICENFGIKTLFVGDADQKSYNQRGGKNPELSFEVLLEYGELEDAIPLVDWAKALEEDFLGFLFFNLMKLEGGQDYERACKALGKNKINYAIKLAQLYGSEPVDSQHLFYQLTLSMKSFVEMGEFTQVNFPPKPTLEEELKDYLFFFVQEDLRGDLRKEDLCNPEEKTVGAFFSKESYGRLNNLLVKMCKSGLPFYVVAGGNYDLKAPYSILSNNCEGVNRSSDKIEVNQGNYRSLIIHL